MPQEHAEAGIYSLADTLKWTVKGWWITWAEAKNWAWVLQLSFPSGAPQWWIDTHQHEWMWRNHLSAGKPDYWFCYYYRAAARDRFSDWVKRSAKNVATPLIAVVSGSLGSLLHSYTSFSAWIDAIRGRVGTWIPSWSTSLANAASKLFYWLPESIRGNTSTWSELWESIKSAVKTWAKLRFDAAKLWVANTAPWLITGYNLVRGWYDSVATWVSNFKANPYGTIAGLLGAAWTFLKGAWSGLKNFYNNVWVPFKVSLHDFLDHPVLWLYDRFDDEADQYIEILSRWVGKIAEKIIVWAWGES